MSDRAPEDFQNRFRIDFKFDTIVDPNTGDKRIAIVLDPARYEITQQANETMVFDRLDKFMIALRDVEQMIKQALAQRPTGRGQQLGDGRAYISARRTQIQRDVVTSDRWPGQFADRSEEFLAQLPDGVHGFAVLSVDLVNSTMLSETLDVVSNARVTSMVLKELAAVAPFFNAQILKFTGDGVLAYVPTPTFLTANDNAIDCALTMRGLILDAVNPNLLERGYPTLSVRIGIESGGAVAMSVGHSTSKLQRDLIGKTINIACKIQASAKPGEIRIGEIAYRNMHTMWKRGCEIAPTPKDWPFSLDDGSYPIYVFSAAGAILE